MVTYVTLMKWTEQGIKNVKESPQRLDAAKKAIEDAGGGMLCFYLTVGQYDAVSVAEFPSDEAAAVFLLSLGSKGSVRTETLKAYPETEYREIITKI